MINTVLIDAQQIFREGLCRLLEAEEQFQIISSSNNFNKIEKEVPFDQVDLFLIDIEIFLEEIETIQYEIIEKYPEKKVVVLSSNNQKGNVLDIMLVGAHGFLIKEMSFTSFVEAINTIFKGGKYIHPFAINNLLDQFHEYSQKISASDRKNQVRQPTHICTKRECEILQLLTNGESNQGIAEKLNISEKTVKNHLSNIFRKINVRDRTQAVVLAIRNQWVEL